MILQQVLYWPFPSDFPVHYGTGMRNFYQQCHIYLILNSCMIQFLVSCCWTSRDIKVHRGYEGRDSTLKYSQTHWPYSLWLTVNDSLSYLCVVKFFFGSRVLHIICGSDHWLWPHHNLLVVLCWCLHPTTDWTSASFGGCSLCWCFIVVQRKDGSLHEIYALFHMCLQPVVWLIM